METPSDISSLSEISSDEAALEPIEDDESETNSLYTFKSSNSGHSTERNDLINIEEDEEKKKNNKKDIAGLHPHFEKAPIFGRSKYSRDFPSSVSLKIERDFAKRNLSQSQSESSVSLDFVLKSLYKSKEESAPRVFQGEKISSHLIEEFREKLDPETKREFSQLVPKRKKKKTAEARLKAICGSDEEPNYNSKYKPVTPGHKTKRRIEHLVAYNVKDGPPRIIEKCVTPLPIVFKDHGIAFPEYQTHEIDIGTCVLTADAITPNPLVYTRELKSKEPLKSLINNYSIGNFNENEQRVIKDLWGSVKADLKVFGTSTIINCYKLTAAGRTKETTADSILRNSFLMHHSSVGMKALNNIIKNFGQQSHAIIYEIGRRYSKSVINPKLIELIINSIIITLCNFVHPKPQLQHVRTFRYFLETIAVKFYESTNWQRFPTYFDKTAAQ